MRSLTDETMIDYSSLIRQLEEAGFEVRANGIVESPTLVFGCLDNAVEFARAIEAAVHPKDLLPPLRIYNDRDMLNYLMNAFNNEFSVCDRCGHEESTATCDSAAALSDYLAAGQPVPQDELAYIDACNLAKDIHALHYRDQPQNWRVLPDIRGVLSQISNMVAGLTRQGAQPVAPTVPEGWKLVPIVPTHEMCTVEWDVSMSEAHTDDGVSAAAWRAMIAAAPQPLAPTVPDIKGLLDVVRTVACIADKLSREPLTENDPSPLSLNSPLVEAAQMMCVKHGFSPEGLALSAAPQPAEQPQQESVNACNVCEFSSRICEHGTKACTVNHAAAPQADETDPALVRALQDIIALVDKRLLQPPSDVREIDFMVALRWVRDRVKPFAAMQQEGSKG